MFNKPDVSSGYFLIKKMVKVKFNKENHVGIKPGTAVDVNVSFAHQIIKNKEGELVNKDDQEKINSYLESLKPKKKVKKED